MSLGRRTERQEPLWVSCHEMPESPGNPFYQNLNAILDKDGFDAFVENLCVPYYAGNVGRRSIVPGRYFRMLLLGYFEGIDSERGICWRLQDSLSVREFVGLGLTESVPDHSSMTRIRQRLPLEVYRQVFGYLQGGSPKRSCFRVSFWELIPRPWRRTRPCGRLCAGTRERTTSIC